MIVINLKAYNESTGTNAIKLAKICEDVALSTGVRIVICVSAFDLNEVRKSVNIDVYTQHIDNIEPGAHTGFVSATHARAKGADGTLLNHAEHRLDWNTLVETASKAKEEGLGTILCADTLDFAEKELELFPNEIALEIPELIGGNVSVSKANPKLIKDAVLKIGENKLLVGAGVKTAEDVKIALSLGAKGVLLASGFVLSTNPHKDLLSLAKAFI